MDQEPGKGMYDEPPGNPSEFKGWQANLLPPRGLYGEWIEY